MIGALDCWRGSCGGRRSVVWMTWLKWWRPQQKQTWLSWLAGKMAPCMFRLMGGHLSCSQLPQSPTAEDIHHITISCEAPGVTRLKLAADTEEEQLQLLRDEWKPAATELPPVLPPPGLTLERQRYLYHHIWDYCTESTKDTVCPRSQQPTGRSECALEINHLSTHSFLL